MELRLWSTLSDIFRFSLEVGISASKCRQHNVKWIHNHIGIRSSMVVGWHLPFDSSWWLTVPLHVKYTPWALTNFVPGGALLYNMSRNLQLSSLQIYLGAPQCALFVRHLCGLWTKISITFYHNLYVDRFQENYLSCR